MRKGTRPLLGEAHVEIHGESANPNPDLPRGFDSEQAKNAESQKVNGKNPDRSFFVETR